MRQRLAVPDNSLISSIGTVPTGTAGYLDISCTGTNPLGSPGNSFYFNSAADLAMPGRRAMLNGDPRHSAVDAARHEPGQRLPHPGRCELGSAGQRPDPDQCHLLRRPRSPDRRHRFRQPLGSERLHSDMSNNANFGTCTTTAGTTGSYKVFDTWSQSIDEAFNYSTWATAGTATSVPLPNLPSEPFALRSASGTTAPPRPGRPASLWICRRSNCAGAMLSRLSATWWLPRNDVGRESMW